MFTLGRNISIVASILFLLMGGMLHQLRQEESTAYRLLLNQHELHYDKQGNLIDDDYYLGLGYPNGSGYQLENSMLSAYQNIAYNYQQNNVEKLLLIKQKVGLVSLDLYTYEEQVILEGINIGVFEVPNRNKILVVTHNPIYEVSLYQLYSLNLDDYSTQFIALLSPYRTRVNIYENGWISYETRESILYKYNLDSRDRQIISHNDILTPTQNSSDDMFKIFYSPDKSSYVYFNPTFDAWIVFDTLSQISTFISPLLDIDGEYKFLAWTDNNWLIIEIVSSSNHPPKRR